MATLSDLASYPAPRGLDGHEGSGSAVGSTSTAGDAANAPGDTTPKQSSGHMGWRGLAVDDLQLSPALTVSSSSSLAQALNEAAMRDFSILPVTDAQRRLLGYVDATASGSVDPTASVGASMRRFDRSKPFETITPDTDLATLDGFLSRHDFACVEALREATDALRIVSDASRRFVLGVVTRDDLAKFVQRWAPRG